MAAASALPHARGSPTLDGARNSQRRASAARAFALLGRRHDPRRTDI